MLMVHVPNPFQASARLAERRHAEFTRERAVSTRLRQGLVCALQPLVLSIHPNSIKSYRVLVYAVVDHRVRLENCRANVALNVDGFVVVVTGDLLFGSRIDRFARTDCDAKGQARCAAAAV